MNSIKGFAAMLASEEKSNLTIEKYLRDVKAFLFFCKGELTRESVLKYKEHIGSGYEKTSANSMIAALNCFLKFTGHGDLCVKQFRIQKKPFCPEEKELTREEYIRLVKTAEKNGNDRLSHRIRAIRSYHNLLQASADIPHHTEISSLHIPAYQLYSLSIGSDYFVVLNELLQFAERFLDTDSNPGPDSNLTCCE